jgi:hypothetical protein
MMITRKALQPSSELELFIAAGMGDQKFPGRCRMSGFVPIMWSVWALLVVLMIILKIYIGRLSRDEDDQIVLDDAFDHVKAEQAAIMAKVNKLEPARKATLWLVGLASLFVVGYYVVDIINQFK